MLSIKNSAHNGVAIVWFMVFITGFSLAQEIRTNAMPGTDFAKYHTYKWGTIEANRHPNQIVDAEIKQAIDAQLTSKGLTKIEGDNPDLLVVYQVAVGHEREWQAFGSGGFRWSGLGTATSSTIDNGTVSVDLYDHASRNLVWRGEATKTLDESANQEKNQKNLDKAMEKLFKHYPPK